LQALGVGGPGQVDRQRDERLREDRVVGEQAREFFSRFESEDRAGQRFDCERLQLGCHGPLAVREPPREQRFDPTL